MLPSQYPELVRLLLPGEGKGPAGVQRPGGRDLSREEQASLLLALLNRALPQQLGEGAVDTAVKLVKEGQVTELGVEEGEGQAVSEGEGLGKKGGGRGLSKGMVVTGDHILLVESEWPRTPLTSICCLCLYVGCAASAPAAEQGSL